MKKKLNYKKKSYKKIIVVFYTILVFSFFITSTLILSNKKSLILDDIFKVIPSKINTFIINNMYKTNNLSNEIKNSKITYLKKENDNLKEILNLKQTNKNYVSAEVINHSLGTYLNKLEINKGNLKLKSPVINNKGLIGFISSTSKNISKINLLTNIDENNMLSIIIKSEGNDVSGILFDYDEKKDLFKIKDIISKNIIKKDDKVVLTGYNGKKYDEIYIGKVVKWEISDFGITKNVWVKSDVNFNDILFVLVQEEIK